MRYIKIPAPIPEMGMTADGKPSAYEFQAFLKQFVWGSELWRSSNEAVASFVRVSGELTNTAEGIVAIESEDFENLARAAREAHASFAPAVVVQLMGFVHAITSASATAN